MNKEDMTEKTEDSWIQGWPSQVRGTILSSRSTKQLSESIREPVYGAKWGEEIEWDVLEIPAGLEV